MFDRIGRFTRVWCARTAPRLQEDQVLDAARAPPRRLAARVQQKVNVAVAVRPDISAHARHVQSSAGMDEIGERRQHVRPLACVCVCARVRVRACARVRVCACA
eukprot:3242999-Pleurochrysis_carterae.AAC.1